DRPVELVQEVEAAPVGQPHVEQEHVRSAALERRPRLGERPGGVNLEAFLPDELREGRLGHRIVVYDERAQHRLLGIGSAQTGQDASLLNVRTMRATSSVSLTTYRACETASLGRSACACSSSTSTAK